MLHSNWLSYFWQNQNPLWEPVGDLAALFPIQLLRETKEDDLSAWVPAATWKPWWSLWLWSGPTLALTVLEQVNQSMQDLSLSFLPVPFPLSSLLHSLYISAFQINISKPIRSTYPLTDHCLPRQNSFLILFHFLNWTVRSSWGRRHVFYFFSKFPRATHSVHIWQLLNTCLPLNDKTTSSLH